MVPAEPACPARPACLQSRSQLRPHPTSPRPAALPSPLSSPRRSYLAGYLALPRGLASVPHRTAAQHRPPRADVGVRLRAVASVYSLVSCWHTGTGTGTGTATPFLSPPPVQQTNSLTPVVPSLHLNCRADVQFLYLNPEICKHADCGRQTTNSLR